jgi:class 3 adenylate cyclase
MGAACPASASTLCAPCGQAVSLQNGHSALRLPPKRSGLIAGKTVGVRESEVRFAEHAGNYLAYSVFGEGRHDVAVSHWRFPIDLIWEFPQLAVFMEALGRMARVIVHDSRGCGASDTISEPGASFAEELADDTLAVLDAVGSDQVTLFDMETSGHGVAFAATYPERIRSLISVNLRPSFPELQDLSDEDRSRLALRLRSIEWLRIENPRVAHDPELQRWWPRALRLAVPRDRLVKLLEYTGRINYEAFLPLLPVPTLVLHRRDNRVWDIETSRAAARLIPDARFGELPGSENDIYLGDTAPVLAEIERFLSQPDVEVVHDRPLATVLFTDIVGSTEQLAARGDDAWRRLLDSLDQTMDRVVEAYRGRIVKRTGDGILSTFDGPARAVHSATAILEAAKAHDITLRAGLHTGEIEIRPSDVTGIAVHIANRIAALANANEILVSRTVVDLTAGSGLNFEPRGEHQLKGVPGAWHLFATLAGS